MASPNGQGKARKKPTQLPLPTSNASFHHFQRGSTSPSKLVANSSPRQYASVGDSPVGTASLAQASTMATAGSPSPTSREPASLQSSTLNIGLSQSMIHAGGIQPSASFFRPARPDQVDRPSSSGSVSSSHIRAPDPGFFQLSPLTPVRTHSSEDLSMSTHGRESMSTDEMKRQFSVSKRIKRSREPLLPISNISESLVPSTVNTIDQNKASGKSQSSPLERMFRRGISGDSPRKSASSTGLPVDGHNSPVKEGQFPRQGNGHPAYPLVNSPQHKITRSRTINDAEIETRDIKSPNQTIEFSPETVPSLAAQPLKSPSGRLIRNYERHPSQNRFFFGGRLLTGGDSPWAFIASFILLLAIAGLWLGVTAVWWWRNISPVIAIIGAYLTLIVISTMLATATQDPGILPRNLDLDPPYPSSSPSNGSHVPLPRDLAVRMTTVRVKYCTTCQTYRPPRSSHCKMCDNCVEDCDHHCQWVNNCVGRRNYSSFFAFLTSTVITLLLVIITSALHIYYLTKRDGLSIQAAFSNAAVSAVVFGLSVCVLFPVTALLVYHMRLLLLNITTIEQLRNQAHKSLDPDAKPVNPFTYGSWRRNFVEIMCRPQGVSWLNASSVATEDKRSVNPAFDGRYGRITPHADP